MKNSLKFLPFTIFFIIIAINNYLWTKIELDILSLKRNNFGINEIKIFN